MLHQSSSGPFPGPNSLTVTFCKQFKRTIFFNWIRYESKDAMGFATQGRIMPHQPSGRPSIHKVVTGVFPGSVLRLKPGFEGLS